MKHCSCQERGIYRYTGIPPSFGVGGKNTNFQAFEPRKKMALSILSVYYDPYINWVGFHPLYIYIYEGCSKFFHVENAIFAKKKSFAKL